MKCAKHVVLVGAMLLSLVGCGTYDVEFKEDETSIEYGDTIDRSEIEKMVTNANSINDYTKFEIDGDELDASKEYDVGEHTLTVINSEKEYDHKIKVEDTTSPEITQNTFTVGVGEQKELKELFDVTDKSEFDYSVDGNVDFQNAGNYTVTVKANDTYGNESSKECTITVKDYEAERKAEEDSMTEEEEDKAFEVATDFVSLNYGNQGVSFTISGMSQKIVTKIAGELIVQLPCTIENDFGVEREHSMVIHVESLPNHQVGNVTQIAIDGEIIYQ